MPIRKRSINGPKGYTDYPHLNSNYDSSNYKSYSHKVNEPTNFNLKEITLEDIDQAVFQEFNERFKIGINFMPVVLLDAELASLNSQNWKQYDEDKGFINLPIFTMFREISKPLRKTNPSFKPVIYTIPIQKANGLVFEEYITEGPLEYELIYDFKFITNFREYTNSIEKQMRHYFRNKRNIISCMNERFVIGPVDQNELSKLEIVNRESVEQRTLYVTTFTLKLVCFTRSLENMQKRERPNTFFFDIQVSDSLNPKKESEVTVIQQVEIKPKTLPDHP